EAKIDQDRPIHLLRRSQPAIGLVGEAVLEVVNTHGAQSGFREVENLMTFRRPLSSEKVALVVSVEMDFVGDVADFLAFLEFLSDVRVSGGCDEGGEPIQP